MRLALLFAGLSALKYMGSGQHAMQAEQYGEAARQFEQALKSDPGLTEARLQLAICYFELRQYEPARRLFTELRQMGKSANLSAYYLGRIDLAGHDLDSAIRNFRSLARGDPVRDELYYLGVAYFKQQQFALAVESLKKAIVYNPRDFRSHQLLARAYSKLNLATQAEREFAETKRLHEYYVEGSVAISGCRALLLSGQLDKAWETCRPLLDTDDVDKLVTIGMLFGKAEQYEHARVVWEKGLRLDPDSPEIAYNLALTCFHLKDLPGAREHAAAAIRLRPDFFEANVLYGTVLYMGAEDEAAIRVLTRAHDLHPEDDSVRRLLAQELSVYAETFAAREDWQRATSLLQQAAALLPDSAEIASRLGRFRARLPRTIK